MPLKADVMVPMRDGTRLATDLHLPEDGGGTRPVILIRTPYDKRTHREPGADAHAFMRHGYAVAVQDVRGKFASEGRYEVAVSDPEDGYDTVSWLAAQSWCSGRVGTYGCSYLGENQLQLARLGHRSHAAMIPKAAAGAYHPRYFGLRTGGALELMEAVHWLGMHGARTAKPIATGAAVAAPTGSVTPGGEFDRLCRTLPVASILGLAGAESSDFEGFVTREPADPWWDRLGYVKPGDAIPVPGLHINSWYDYGVAETLELVRMLGDGQFAIISPARHCESEAATEDTVVGARSVGDARRDYMDLYLRWFDHWLLDRDTGVTARPRYELFVIGRGAWRADDAWPPAAARLTRLYLHSAGAANSRRGDGGLLAATPGDQPADRFMYDPADPVPSVGGPVSPVTASDPSAEQGSFDQGPVEDRDDVLVYSTPPLERGVEVTGPVTLVLYASSSAPDTDFTGKLVDVDPDGRAFNVQEGILRARYREGGVAAAPLVPDAIYELRVDLGAVSNWFAPRHRIRLEVSSSNFPRFDRNLNTGGANHDETAWSVAVNSIHHSDGRASHLELYVVEEADG
jgi:putative CocE/NonD family hydrolase